MNRVNDLAYAHGQVCVDSVLVRFLHPSGTCRSDCGQQQRIESRMRQPPRRLRATP